MKRFVYIMFAVLSLLGCSIWSNQTSEDLTAVLPIERERIRLASPQPTTSNLDETAATPSPAFEHEGSAQEAPTGEQNVTEHEVISQETPTGEQSTTAYEAAEHATPEATPTSPIDLDSLNSVSTGGEYYIAVSYAVADEVSSLAAGVKRITVVATLSNQVGATVKVGPDSLALIDQDGSRFAPLPEIQMQPALIGAELVSGESVYGFASFEIPTDTTEAILEWCLDGPHPCEQPLQASIP